MHIIKLGSTFDIFRFVLIYANVVIIIFMYIMYIHVHIILVTNNSSYA